ncbi:class I SAM-dependent methyltransferase [Dactylosporangium sp. NPDC005555]|uniref:class I SAM-dependent methyltransferase n=1 Tax=Dactylosporangium sp. NPDC005555 TaxID=3154889 RepID=UPI0033BBDFF7
MFDAAIGARLWPDYVATLDEVLAPGGRIGLQAITMAHARMLATRDTYTWIQTYGFPGGLLPSQTAIDEALAGHTRLAVLDRHSFGPHYATTLRLWRERFAAHTAEVAALGFDATTSPRGCARCGGTPARTGSPAAWRR